jgi:hypothetical protein
MDRENYERVAVNMNDGTTKIVWLPMSYQISETISLLNGAVVCKFVKVSRNNFLIYEEEKVKNPLIN